MTITNSIWGILLLGNLQSTQETYNIGVSIRIGSSTLRHKNCAVLWLCILPKEQIKRRSTGTVVRWTQGLFLCNSLCSTRYVYDTPRWRVFHDSYPPNKKPNGWGSSDITSLKGSAQNSTRLPNALGLKVVLQGYSLFAQSPATAVNTVTLIGGF